jgi:hypothetical protein
MLMLDVNVWRLLFHHVAVRAASIHPPAISHGRLNQT